MSAFDIFLSSFRDPLTDCIYAWYNECIQRVLGACKIALCQNVIIIDSLYVIWTYLYYKAAVIHICNNDEGTWMLGVCKLELGSALKYDNYKHFSCDFDVNLS